MSGVRFRSRSDAESAVKVFARKNEFRGFGDIDGIEAIQETQGGDGAKREPSVHFTVNVAEKRTVVLEK